MSPTQSDDFSNRCLQIVKGIVLQYVPGETKVFLFGSWAKKKQSRSSNMDVGFLGKAPIQAAVFSKMRGVLEESIVPFQVDLIDFYNKSKEFKKLAFKKIVLWKN